MAANPSDSNDAGTNPISADRRDFFRITDQIGLEIHRQAADDTDASSFNGSHADALRTEFRRLDQDVRVHLSNLAERDRLLTSLLKSLNGKIDTLARIMAFEQNPLQPEHWQEVTLSEGGLSFSTTTSTYSVNEHLSMRLTLPPELYQPVAMARILAIEPDENGDCRVHTEFVDIHDADRQQIARHILRWQVRQRQNQ